jgi:creatinine amidohydrolase
MAHMTPAELREYLGDGNFAGRYQRADDEMASIWEVAVTETRRLLEGPWE